MEETQKGLIDNLVLSCAYEKLRAHEQFVPEHFLGIHISGETQVQTTNGSVVYEEGSIILVRKNQLMRATKTPGSNGEYKSIIILLNEDILRKYATEHKIDEQERYSGENILIVKPEPFIKGYFTSLLPYANSSIKKGHSLSDIKIYEGIELLLRQNPALKTFLFDFNEPHKIDIEKFMMQNYMFNVPITQFARLTGRSIAAFKRDFTFTFNQSPRKWLQEKRLSEAYMLIKEKKQKATDIYLDIGFENVSHFYYSFKQKYGVTHRNYKWIYLSCQCSQIFIKAVRDLYHRGHRSKSLDSIHF